VFEIFLAVNWELLDFYLSRLNLFVKVFILWDAALNIFLAESPLAENARLFGEFILIFWVCVKVMFVLVVILGYDGTFFIFVYSF